MKIDTGAFIKSLPIMGIGLLGIFIVTAVIIIGIYILRAITSKDPTSDPTGNSTPSEKEEEQADPSAKKESAMDLMEEREMKDYLKTDDTLYISKDL